MKKIVLSLSVFLPFIMSSCSEDNECSKPCKEKVCEKENNIVNVQTFEEAKVTGSKQGMEGTFTFPTDMEKVKSIKVYIRDICPNESCDEWDRFANLYVKNKESNVWYEMCRFITPYWVGTEKLERGLEIDVTDFKSLLSGKTELKIYTETFNDKGRTYSIDFDVEYGKPDYKYSSVVPVIQYNESSQAGVPYGEPHDKDLTKTIKLPKGTEKAHLRTIISGWGHASPLDMEDEGRGCSEWCLRQHQIFINDKEAFEHKMWPLGCSTNPIDNQHNSDGTKEGTWPYDRAGWCPGMVVPNRINELDSALFNEPINFEYKFRGILTSLKPKKYKEWVNDMKNGRAFYAISTFVIAKSNSSIEKPIIED